MNMAAASGSALAAPIGLPVTYWFLRMLAAKRAGLIIARKRLFQGWLTPQDSGAFGMMFSAEKRVSKVDYRETQHKLRSSFLRHMKLDPVLFVLAARSFQVKRIEWNLLEE